jgi:glycolate oxidase
MTASARKEDSALGCDVIRDLIEAVGPDNVLVDKPSRYVRARVPAPFPVHRWNERLPDAVVLPGNTEEVAKVVRIANHYKVPIVPRAGGTGLTDGAVPECGGIVLDVKRLNKIVEIDTGLRTATVGVALNMQKLNERLLQHGLLYPDDPASYPCALIGGRIGTSGWSLLGSRYGHTRDLVISFTMVTPTGEIVQIGDGGGKKVTKSSSGLSLKHLFMGHQGTLGIATEATLKLYPKPEAEFAAFFGFTNYEAAWRAARKFAQVGAATFAGAVLFDERKVAYLRRDDEVWIPQPKEIVSLTAVAAYGFADEVECAARRYMKAGRDLGGRYLGDAISTGDWASRHDRYATPLHGRCRSGQVVPMSWHCEDAALTWDVIPQVRNEWHAVVDNLIRQHDLFDDWGMFTYTSGPTGVDALVEVDVGIWEQNLDDASWNAWIAAKREISQITLKYGGSMSACHGSCREGEVDLLPQELGAGVWDIQKKIKAALDPNHIMNTGKYLFNQAYRGENK